MKTKLFLVTVLLACVAAATISVKPAAKSTVLKITGDYVEARTASVFCGACHYNGELVTTGHDALMVWCFAGGSFNGVDLGGVRAVAAVTSETNLINDAPHRSELVIDSNATEQQVAAVISLLRSKCGDQLGEIAVVRRAPIVFSHVSNGYSVNVNGFATLAVQYMPDDSCCTMASDVWYSPLSPIEHRKVGYTETATYTGSIADPWQRSAENSAFYGAFSF